jgi:hypothetical protein
MEVLRFMHFHCDLDANNDCVDPGLGLHYKCESDSIDTVNGVCTVNGREMLHKTQGIPASANYWEFFGWLCFIYFLTKIAVVFLTFIPFNVLVYKARVFLYRICGAKSDAAHESLIQSARESRVQRASANTRGSYEMVPVVSGDGPPKPDVPHPPKAVNGYGKVPAVAAAAGSDGDLKASSGGATLAWSNVTVTLAKKGGTVLVDHVSGFVSSGRILALMGPSGAG